MYVTASRSIDKGSTIAPMRLKITPNPAESKDVGYTILNQFTEKIRPRLYEIRETSVGANSVIFKASLSEEGTIYHSVM